MTREGMTVQFVLEQDDTGCQGTNGPAERQEGKKQQWTTGKKVIIKMDVFFKQNKLEIW